MAKIAFIGGIHGVGKGTICKDIAQELGYVHLTASSLLKWNEISLDVTNKSVQDLNINQDRLIEGLRKTIQADKLYILDGHFCLTSKAGVIEPIPITTFQQIRPFSLNVLLDDVVAIKARLEKRDSRSYNLGELRKFQDSEVFYAKQVSDSLNIPLNICTPTDISSFINSLKHHT